MLDANIDSFFDIAITNAFVNDDPNCRFCYVVDNAGFAVVDLMRHAGWRLELLFQRTTQDGGANPF